MTSAATNSLFGQGKFPAYPLDGGYRQRPLNTPANTNGKINHNYYLVTGNGNDQPAANSQYPPKTSTPGLFDSTQLHMDRGQSTTVYQSREQGRSDSDSGRSEYGVSTITRSANFGSGGEEEAAFRNEENGGRYQNYRVILQGSLLDKPENERSAADYYPRGGDQYDSLPLPPGGRVQPGLGSGVDKLEWPTVREVMMEVSNRALLEEADSDVTGLTHCLDVPRCSYVPIREVGGD